MRKNDQSGWGKSLSENTFPARPALVQLVPTRVDPTQQRRGWPTLALPPPATTHSRQGRPSHGAHEPTGCIDVALSENFAQAC
jgi:hypothetical protein